MLLRCDFELTREDRENPKLTEMRIKQRVGEAFTAHLMDVIDIRKTPIEKTFSGEINHVESGFHYLTEDQFASIMYKLDMIDRLGRFIDQPDFIYIARQIKGIFNDEPETPRFNLNFDENPYPKLGWQPTILKTRESSDRWQKEYFNHPDEPSKPPK